MKVQLDETRYDRQELITWWDQAALRAARVLIVGAGALGNELIKNCALLGIGQLHIVDLDRIEHSNLARCVLFGDSDEGEPKATVAACRAARINPEIVATAEVGDVMRWGAGRFAEYDVVLGGLDNREARLWINEKCRKLGVPWVDGAIEGIRGVARVFPPEGACYECSLGAVDRQILARRQSCSLLTPAEMSLGKTPTTATSASIVAAVQVQEAVKILNGRWDLVALKNKAFIYTGETMETYVVSYSEDPSCLAHDDWRGWIPHAATPGTTFATLLDGYGPDAVIDLDDELIVEGQCTVCGTRVSLNRVASALRGSVVPCGSCGAALAVLAQTMIGRGDAVGKLTLGETGMPDRSVVSIREGSERVHLMLEQS